MHVKMNAYMAQLLGDGVKLADEATVDATRLSYWKKYGATLLGLIEHHNVDAADFLHATHQFDNLPDMVRFESGLQQLLKRLPGKKILFTNSPENYARAVLLQLGLHRHFDQHISIESMVVHGRLRPKPSRWLLRKLIAKRKLAASRCVLVEDSRDNLRTAKQMGMKTVWVTQYVNKGHGGHKAHRSHKGSANKVQGIRQFARASFIDVKIRSIRQLPARLSRIDRIQK
jgi:putative hydrolase of the HAD superfamily